MRKVLLTFFASMLFNVVIYSQTLIAGWDFQTTTTGGTAVLASPSTPKVYNANFGAGTIYLDGTNGSSDWFVPATGSTNTELNAFTGSTENTGGVLTTTTTSPAALAVVGGASNAANGKRIVFAFSMTSHSYFKITFAGQRTSTGFDSQLWEYSANGGTSWVSMGSVVAGTASGTLTSSFGASGPITVIAGGGGSGLSGVANALVRVTFSGATSATGNNRIDNIRIEGSSTALPVTFTSFSATKDGKNNLLSWATASEQNNAGFEVQRSTDGSTYENIGFVKSLSPTGNSSSSLSYSFTDFNPLGLQQYYRLKQTDLDGKSAYSAIVLVKREAPATLTVTKVYPNPSTSSIYINAACPAATTLQLSIVDMNGRVVGRKQVNAMTGNNGFDMPVTQLAPGTYLLQVLNADNKVVTTEKFIKQ